MIFLSISFLPVVTIGASLTAAFYSGIKLVRDEESYVYKDFWKSFKMNFVQGFLLEIVHGVIGFLLFIDLRASVQWGLVQGAGYVVIRSQKPMNHSDGTLT